MLSILLFVELRFYPKNQDFAHTLTLSHFWKFLDLTLRGSSQRGARGCSVTALSTLSNSIVKIVAD